MYKKYYLILLVVISAGCSSIQYQQAKGSSESPWGVCKASGVFNEGIKLYLLSEGDQKRWLEGHSAIKLDGVEWEVEIRSDLYASNHKEICMSSLIVRRDGLDYVNKSREMLSCENSLAISSSFRTYLKSKSGKWENVKFDCKKNR